MPRDLSEVLHHLIPELAPAVERRSPPPRLRPLAPVAEPEAAPTGLPILTVAIDSGEIVQATLVWNLALEMARAGHRAVVLAPGGARARGLWPGPGASGGVELLLPRVSNEAELGRAALATAESLPASKGLVLAAAPSQWLGRAAPTSPLLGWLLVIATPARRSVARAATLLETVRAHRPQTRVSFASHATRSALERDWIRHQLERAAGSPGPALRACGDLSAQLPLGPALVRQRPLHELADPDAARSLRGVATRLLAAARPTGTNFGTE